MVEACLPVPSRDTNGWTAIKGEQDVTITRVVKAASVARETESGLAAIAEHLLAAFPAERVYCAVLESDQRLCFRAVAPSEERLPRPVAVLAYPALQVAMDAEDPTTIREPLAGPLGCAACVVVPLRHHGVVVGAVVVPDPPARVDSAVERLAALLRLASAHVAALVEIEGLRHDRLVADTWRGVFEAVIEASTDAVRIVDFDGRVLAWNAASERLYGWTADEVVGTVLPVVPPKSRQKVIEDIRRSAHADHVIELDAVAVRKDGSLVNTHLMIVPVPDGAGNDVASVNLVREVGTDTRFERMRDEFASRVSSMLKDPLTAVVGMAQLLGRAEIADDRQRRTQLARGIDLRARQMAALVDDFMLVTAMRDGTLELDAQSLDLVGVAAEAIRVCEDDATGHTFVLEVDSRLPRVRADHQRIRQALAHLLENAVARMPDGGTVWVSVASAEDEAVIRIVDTGPSASAEELNGAFYRFHNAEDTSHDGPPGLGLLVVRAIAEAHGGTARVEDGPSGGVAFSIRLPWPKVVA
jgi:PAS domain S-box-containing protein